MAVIDSILKEELARLKALRARYSAQRAALPPGSVVLKKKGRRVYAYRAYRDGRRVVTAYLGPEASPKAKQFAAILGKRRTIAKEIKAIDANAKRLQKMIHVR